MNLKYTIVIGLLSLFSLASCQAENKLSEVKQTSNSEHKIRATIQNYFEGRRNADINLLQKAFSKKARLMTTNPDNQLIIISLEDYFSVVTKQGKISVKTTIEDLRIEDQLGYAKVIFDYGSKSYTDFLLLIKSDIGWRIVNKSFKLDEVK